MQIIRASKSSALPPAHWTSFSRLRMWQIWQDLCLRFPAFGLSVHTEPWHSNSTDLKEGLFLIPINLHRRREFFAFLLCITSHHITILVLTKDFTPNIKHQAIFPSCLLFFWQTYVFVYFLITKCNYWVLWSTPWKIKNMLCQLAA